MTFAQTHGDCSQERFCERAGGTRAQHANSARERNSPMHFVTLSIVVLLLVSVNVPHPAFAADDQYGSLDFSRLSPAQADLLQFHVRVAASAEAFLTICAKPRDFERKAIAAIQRCVTADALRKADSIYKILFRHYLERFKKLGYCEKGFTNTDGTHWTPDMIIHDDGVTLDYQVRAITDLCQKCRTSVWAAFCR